MSLTVVVADDSRLARKQLIRSLPGDWAVEITQAANGGEALDAFRAGCDLMFLDLTMPDMDGYQVLEALSGEAPAGTRLPVIVVSADVQPKAIARVKELGALDFVQKPADAETLRRVLQDNGWL